MQDALAKAAHTTPGQRQLQRRWGRPGEVQVTKKAIEALIIFFIAVTLYISVRFEFKMAVAAIVAVIHDILVTVGIYSLAGFQVTPDTVVAVLTVLGYSLYDTVVVFDRIRDNAKGLGASGRITYSEMVNLSMNQTLARSINTSLVAIIPVLSVLVVGSFLLGRHLPPGLRSGPGHRADQWGVLVDLHRLAAPGVDEGAGAPLHHHPPTARDPGGPGRRAHPGHGRGHGRSRPGGGRASGRGRHPDHRRHPPRGGVSGQEGRRRSAKPSAGGANGRSEAVRRIRRLLGHRGRAVAASGSTRPAGNRPPPRPRKGKGKGGKGKRR